MSRLIGDDRRFRGKSMLFRSFGRFGSRLLLAGLIGAFRAALPRTASSRLNCFDGGDAAGRRCKCGERFCLAKFNESNVTTNCVLESLVDLNANRKKMDFFYK